jgi:GT2 family glycosyltransferase
VEISLVVPNRNGAHFLPGCFRGLEPGVEVILVDGASTDGSIEIFAGLVPGGRLVRLEENRGFAAAANAGARAATGRYVAFLNTDTEPQPGWLDALRACLERHPRAAAAAPKILRLAEPGVVDSAGDAITRSLKAYRRGAGERDAGQYAAEEQVFAASGTAALWRADAFRSLGGFDESFFAYYEDVDLGWRARAAGYEAWYAPAAAVLHRGGGSGGDAARRLESYDAVVNRWRTIVKNAPPRAVARNLPWVVLGGLLYLARATARGDAGPTLSAYRAALRRPAGRPEGGEVLREWAKRRFPPARSTLTRRSQAATAGSRASASE